jgi:two-component system, response regulator PdtaR
MAQRPPPPHQTRALIVEDEIMVALGLEAEMRALGFDTCDLAANGQQASKHAMSNQPDVVLIDVNLEGGREGIEVARSLRKVCEAPVVFVTAYTDRDTVERIHSASAAKVGLSRPTGRRCGSGHDIPHVVNKTSCTNEGVGLSRPPGSLLMSIRVRVRPTLAPRRC